MSNNIFSFRHPLLPSIIHVNKIASYTSLHLLYQRFYQRYNYDFKFCFYFVIILRKVFNLMLLHCCSVNQHMFFRTVQQNSILVYLYQSKETERQSGNTGQTRRSTHYVENQAILEPIPLHRASKCKQTKEQGSKDCLWTHNFTLSRCKYNRMKLCYNKLQFVKETQIGTVSSTELRTKLRRSQDSLLIFCQELPVQQLGDRHSNTIELASWLVHVLRDFMTMSFRSFSLP